MVDRRSLPFSSLIRICPLAMETNADAGPSMSKPSAGTVSPLSYLETLNDAQRTGESNVIDGDLEDPLMGSQ